MQARREIRENVQEQKSGGVDDIERVDIEEAKGRNSAGFENKKRNAKVDEEEEERKQEEKKKKKKKKPFLNGFLSCAAHHGQRGVAQSRGCVDKRSQPEREEKKKRNGERMYASTDIISMDARKASSIGQ